MNVRAPAGAAAAQRLSAGALTPADRRSAPATDADSGHLAKQIPLRSRGGRDRLLQRSQDLRRGPLPRLHRAVEVALEVDRRVLAGEVAGAHLLALGARKRLVLTDL